MSTGFVKNSACEHWVVEIDIFDDLLCKNYILTIKTWLILPVVIRLSQRLSHARLSLSNLNSETANGSLYQL
jgi:hypothetical protein